MSPSHVIGYHLLGNIRDYSNLCVPRCSPSAHFSLPMGGGGPKHSHSFYFSNWWPGGPAGPALPSGVVPTQPPTHALGKDENREAIRLEPVTATWCFFLSLSICTGFKISMIKRIFFLRIHQNLKGKKFKREKHSVKNRSIHERYFKFIWRK